MTKILTYKSDVDLDYPICRPSLDLDFTQEELDPRITFSRGSIGTRVNRNRVIETVAANTPRFDYDPVTGECKGLLIEESRQNLLTYSEAPTGWTIGSALVSQNVITSPNGTQTANKLNVGSSTFLQITQSPSATVSNTHTFSLFLKAGELKYVQLRVRNPGNMNNFFRVICNLTTGELTSGISFGTGTYTSASATKFPNDWWRFTVTGIADTSGTQLQELLIGQINASSAASVSNSSPTDGFYWWGAQLETGAFPTSYIPTSGSQVSRFPDLAEMTGTNFSSWYNQSEGSVFANTRMVGVQTGRYDKLWAITNSNLNLEGISIYVAGPAGVSGAYVSSIGITNSATEQIAGAFTLVESAITTPKLRSAFAFKTNDCASAYNGNLRFVDKSAILLSNPDRLLIGQPQRFQGTSCMTIARLTYYPRALKPNHLQYLTQ